VSVRPHGIRTVYERIDARRHKRYAGLLGLEFIVEFDHPDEAPAPGIDLTPVGEILSQSLLKKGSPRTTRGVVPGVAELFVTPGERLAQKVFAIAVRRTEKRPSLIPDQQTMESWLCDDLLDRFGVLLEEELAEAKRRGGRSEAAQRANTVAARLLRRVVMIAKVASNYDARLADLEADLADFKRMALNDLMADLETHDPHPMKQAILARHPQMLKALNEGEMRPIIFTKKDFR
jgi:hypothetical protein